MSVKGIAKEEKVKAKLQSIENRRLEKEKNISEMNQRQNKKKIVIASIAAIVFIGIALIIFLVVQSRALQDETLTSAAIQEFIVEFSGPLEEVSQPVLERMGRGSSVSVEAGIGNEIVYIFTYGTDAGEADLATKSESSLNEFMPLFENLAHEIQHVLFVNYLSITVNYENSAGETVATRRFGGLHP